MAAGRPRLEWGAPGRLTCVEVLDAGSHDLWQSWSASTTGRVAMGGRRRGRAGSRTKSGRRVTAGGVAGTARVAGQAPAGA
jgi:hypothetical protein